VNVRVPISFLLGVGCALAAGWLAFPRLLYRATEQPIQFSHRTHTSDSVGAACEDCHAIGDDGRFAGLPSIEICAGCHAEAMTDSADEKRLVDDYIAKGREIPWLVYARQPVNVHFSHAAHVRLAGIACQECHGEHGESDRLRPLETNRLTGYSRDVDGGLVELARDARTMKMNDCSRCHHERGVRESCMTCHK